MAAPAASQPPKDLPRQVGISWSTRWIIGGFAVVIVLLTTLGSVALVQMKVIASAAENIYEHPLAVSNAARALLNDVVRMRVNTGELIAFGAGEKGEKARLGMQAAAAEAREQLEIIRTRFLGDMEKITAIEDALTEWELLTDEIHRLTVAGLRTEADALAAGRLVELFGELEGLCSHVISFAGHKASFFLMAMREDTRSAMTMVSVLAGVLCLLAIAIAIIAMLRHARGQTEVARYVELVERLSVTDGLTSLYNRRYFDQVLAREVGVARRRDRPLVLSILDVDHFKQYNDRHGHPEGDRLLRHLAGVLSESLNRPDDSVFRIGGEEFAIIFSAADAQEAWRFLDTIRMRIEGMVDASDTGLRWGATATFGAVWALGGRELNTSELYRMADRALFEGKQQRNTVVVKEFVGELPRREGIEAESALRLTSRSSDIGTK